MMLAALDALFERTARIRRLRDAPLAAFLLLPALAVLGVFGIGPLFYAIYISLFELQFGRGPFVGLANYARALSSSDFWSSVLVTGYFAVGTIPVSMALSFVVASCLFRIVRARGFLRTVYFLPYVTSVVAAATVWRGILNPEFGMLNPFVEWLGMSPQRWLLEPRSILSLLTNGLIPDGVGPSLALCCIILFEIWHSMGFMTVIILAGLSAIPRELEESARIDGAGWLQVTRRITLPLLSPTILFLAIVSTIKAFQAFSSFYVLTGAGRETVGATQNLTVYIFSCFYLNGKEGYGAAVATLLAGAIVGLTWVQWRYLGRKVHYG